MENLTQNKQPELLLPPPSPKKTYILIGVIAVIVFVVGGTGLWFLSTQKEKTTQTPAQTPEVQTPTAIVKEETADWQTYRNEQYDFEVRYPGDILSLVPVEEGTYVYPKNAQPERISAIAEKKLMYTSRKASLGKEECSLGDIGTIGECTPEGENGISFIVIEKPLSFFAINSGLNVAGEIIVDGRKGIRYSFYETDNDSSYAYTYDPHGHQLEAYYFSLDQEHTLIISKYTTKDFQESIAYPLDEMMDQILSTFRFAEPVEKTNWQTYRNDKFGFALEYPSSFELVIETDDRIEWGNSNKKCSLEIVINYEYWDRDVQDYRPQDGYSLTYVAGQKAVVKYLADVGYHTTYAYFKNDSTRFRVGAMRGPNILNNDCTEIYYPHLLSTFEFSK